jgi:simple sugar transport system ATP-binding protein
MSNQTTVLRASGITKSFGSVRALQGVDFQVEAGEVVGLVGDNGAGKSTLIKILSGYIQPDAGTIELEGRPVHFSSPAVARQSGIETVYQEQSVADDLSVFANLFLGRELRRRVGPIPLLDANRMRTEARDMLDMLRLRVDVDQEARYCSGGERQGISIARAIYAQAKLVILDEPTNALGVVAVSRVMELISGLRERGISGVFISHNIRHIFDVCDRVVMFVHGSKLLDAPASDTSVEHIIDLLNAKSGARFGT